MNAVFMLFYYTSFSEFRKAGRQGRQTLPVHPRHQPLPLLEGQGKPRLARLGPDEMPPVQAALAQPDAVAVPHQKLEAVAAPVAEQIGAAVAGGGPQCLLHMQRQAVRAQPHVHRLDRQPNGQGLRYQPRHCSNSASQRGETAAGNSSRYCRCESTTGPFAASWATGTGCTWTGISSGCRGFSCDRR